MPTIKANEIKSGQPFRKPRQRKWRIASKVFDLPGTVTEDKQPGILVCLSDCSQVVLGENKIVEIPEQASDLDKSGFVKLGRRRSAEKRRLAGKFA